MPIYRKLDNDIMLINLLYKGDCFDKAMMYELYGKINLAVEMKMISFEQWEVLFDKVSSLNSEV